MKKLTPEQVAIIRNDASRGTGLSELARKYGITWTDVLSIVNHCSYRTPFDPPTSTRLDRHVACLDKQIALLEKKVWNLEAEQERQSDWEREQNE
jgi:hypothetical protein